MENAYQSPESNLVDNNNEDIVYVGFWARTAASILDTIWMYLIIYTVAYFILGEQVLNSDLAFNPAQAVYDYIIPFLIVMGFWMKKSATPGKMLLNMKIVDADTLEKVPNSRLLIRYIAYFISMIPLFLGFMWVGWDKKKQGWHDKLAKTVVIKGS